MKGNGYGSYKTTRDADLAAYDASPPLLRWIARNAVADWAAKPMLKHWRELEAFGIPGRDIARAMASDIRASEARDTLKYYGPTHPEAPQRPARGHK